MFATLFWSFDVCCHAKLSQESSTPAAHGGSLIPFDERGCPSQLKRRPATMPQLLTTGVKFFEEQIDTHTPRTNPLAGLRSGILAGACIVGGAVAAVQGGPWFCGWPSSRSASGSLWVGGK